METTCVKDFRAYKVNVHNLTLKLMLLKRLTFVARLELEVCNQRRF